MLGSLRRTCSAWKPNTPQRTRWVWSPCSTSASWPPIWVYWRTRGLGPRAYRFGKHLKFAVSDVRIWVEQQRDTPSVATAINEQAGVALAAELLGHTDPKITIQHYIRRNEMVNPVTAEMLDRVFKKAS